MPPQRISSTVGAVNEAAWARGEFVHVYASRTLRPVEVLLLVRLRENFSGAVLELGCGGGRIAGYLLALAREFHGIDLAPQMVAESRRRYPEGDFALGDMRDLSRFADGSLDAVVAACNLLDVFDDAERRQVLQEITRVLAPGGVLVMSSHNRAYLGRLQPPWHLRVEGLRRGSPRAILEFAADLVRAPRRIWRHRRLRRLERHTPEFALVSDGSHDFSLVHYYTDPVSQFRRFEEMGLQAELAADLEGCPVTTGEQAADCSELYYVARKPAA